MLQPRRRWPWPNRAGRTLTAYLVEPHRYGSTGGRTMSADCPYLFVLVLYATRARGRQGALTYR